MFLIKKTEKHSIFMYFTHFLYFYTLLKVNACPFFGGYFIFQFKGIIDCLENTQLFPYFVFESIDTADIW